MLLYFFGLITFLFVVGYLFFSNSAIFKNPNKSVKIVESVPTIEPLVSPSSTDSSAGGKEVSPKGWLIHTNNREGYSFKYPEYWNLNPLKEDADYLFGTTTMSDKSNKNTNAGAPGDGDLKLEISKTPQTVIQKDLNNFESFLNNYVNKDQKKEDTAAYTLLTCKKDTGSDFTLIENVYACSVSETTSNFPLPYQTYFFYKGPKLYSLYVYGKPSNSQLEDLKLFKENLQLID